MALFQMFFFLKTPCPPCPCRLHIFGCGRLFQTSIDIPGSAEGALLEKPELPTQKTDVGGQSNTAWHR